jgi:hypothetical protein
MSNCNNCLPTSITWSPANNGTLNCTGTSASTVYTCYSNEIIFYTDWNGASGNIIRQYDPSNGSNNFLTGATFDYPYGIANTNNKLWVQGSDFTSINEYTIAYSPITPGNTIIVTGPVNKPIIGLNKLNSLVAISEDVLVGGGDFAGNKIIAYPVSGSTIYSVELFTLPVADLDCFINDIKYDKNKQTLVITYYDNSLTKYYISEYTTGGTIVNEIEMPYANTTQIVSLATFSGINYILSGGVAINWTWYTYDNLIDLNLVSTSVLVTSGYQTSSSQALGVFRSPFTSTGSSYCLSTMYSSTSQYDGNYYSGGTYDGYGFYVGNGNTTGFIYYNTGTTSWCLSTSLGGTCILFGSNTCQSEVPNLSESFFTNSICPTPTPSPTNDCSVLAIDAFFDCDIPMPTPSITPTMTPSPTVGYIYPTPTPTMTMSPTPSGNVCANVNFCFSVQNVSPSPSPTPTMTPSSMAGRNTPAGGVVTFTTINGEVICPPSQLG